MQHTIQREIRGVAIFIAVMWSVLLVDWVLPADFTQWGIVPRTVWGLVGIPLAPFLHAGLGHILSNTLPLVVLLTLLAGSRANSWEVVAEIGVVGGGLLWLFGRQAGQAGQYSHVGASGLIYGLIAFLLVSGFREKRPVPLLIALLVGFLYGGTLISGVLPSLDARVSWDGHLFGALAGGAAGYFSIQRATSDQPAIPPPAE